MEDMARRSDRAPRYRDVVPVRAARCRRLGLGLGQAFAWLIIIIFMLGYLPTGLLPDRRRTVDLGVLIWCRSTSVRDESRSRRLSARSRCGISRPG
jgi:hypothetical protein